METTAPTFASDEAIKALALDDVKSSQIAAIGHDPGTDTLVVKFHNGGLYAYAGVPHHKFEAMKAAESTGKYLGAHIKGKHEFRKVPTGETHAGAQQG
ncbi:MAG: KTSC domain-containing protein [Bradyrhizobium sp.]|nr:KTSC domain-containing protein [Bradyrhizobium sp.]